MSRAQKIVGTPSNAIDLRRQKFVNGLVAGMSMRQAALEAGYSESMADQACREIMPHCRAAFQQALHHRISIGKLSGTIAAGLDAEETQFFAEEGVVVDQRDVIAWGERRRYAELASKLMGFEPEKAANSEPSRALVVEVLTEGQMTRVAIASTALPDGRPE